MAKYRVYFAPVTATSIDVMASTKEEAYTLSALAWKKGFGIPSITLVENRDDAMFKNLNEEKSE